jgi:hypothetical protein
MEVGVLLPISEETKGKEELGGGEIGGTAASKEG